MSNKIVLILLFFVVSIVFYFSWLSDPSFRNETYLPKWLLTWSNNYYNLRTAIPFIVFGFLLEFYTQHRNTKNSKIDIRINLVQNLGIAAIVVCIAEGGQFITQRRNPDLMDVFFGISGSLIGGLVYNLFKIVKNAK